jgi:hypothetical protein
VADRTMISFEIDQDVADALRAWKERDGINISEQLRRAVRSWLEQHGQMAAKGAAKKKTRK